MLHGLPNYCIPGEGRLSSKIAIVGSSPSQDDLKTRLPFTGKIGHILEQCLASAEIARSDCYLTYVIKEGLPDGDMTPFFDGKRFCEKPLKRISGRDYVQILNAELTRSEANVFVAVGKEALAALTNRTDIFASRGYVIESTLLPGRKVIPIVSPRFCMHGNYIFRHVTVNDLNKALIESKSPEFNYPKISVIAPMEFNEVVHFLSGVVGKSPIACDIETSNNQVSAIGFCFDPHCPISIPIMGAGWSLYQEVQIWELIAAILEDPTTVKVWQNGIFDRSFLLKQNHIRCKGQHIDTMNDHSIIYLEYPKSLGFLTSIYLNRPIWKGMVKWKSNKKEE